MLTETENMVPDSRRRLRDAMDDLEASIVSPACVCALAGRCASCVCVQERPPCVCACASQDECLRAYTYACVPVRVSLRPPCSFIPLIPHIPRNPSSLLLSERPKHSTNRAACRHRRRKRRTRGSRWRMRCSHEQKHILTNGTRMMVAVAESTDPNNCEQPSSYPCTYIPV